jgi:hypothetical protein
MHLESFQISLSPAFILAVAHMIFAMWIVSMLVCAAMLFGPPLWFLGKILLIRRFRHSMRLYWFTPLIALMALLTIGAALDCHAQTGSDGAGMPVAAKSTAATAATASPTPSAGADLSAFLKDVTSGTNWSAQAGGGVSSGGGKYLAYAAVAYDFTANVGVIAGYDALYGPHSQIENAVNGGITLQTTIQPFAFVGSTFLTNIVAQPYVADLIATPKGGNAIGNVLETGANFEIYKLSNFSIDLNLGYQVRSGEADFSGNYFTGGLGLTRRF